MKWIDWIIVLVPLSCVCWIGWYARRHVRTASDYLAGGRVAGRYLLAVAGHEAGIGLISVIALFEMYYRSGFAVGFWQGLGVPVSLLISLTGFAVYRYRETRAMTLAQFFELRYSRSFRIFSGALAWLSGVVNYALFPAVGARFIVYYTGLPPQFAVLGFSIRTFAVVMALFLGLALVIVLLGGHLTNMVTDCVAGLLSYVMYAAVVIAVLSMFSWSQIRESLTARPAGASLLNPFDTAMVEDFNMFFVIIGILGGIYNILSWQGSLGYNAAAASPHEQKMGKVLGMWRAGMSILMIMLLAVAAYTYMHHPAFTDAAASVEAELASQINLDSPVTTQTIRDQMRVPMAVKHFLPVGVSGAFFAVMIMLLVSTDTTYLHSWGSILVQDVILPIRGRLVTPRQQIWLLRLSILLVAIFAYIFSLYFNQVTYILMFMALTGSVWLGGAGAVILGGLYWKRGTTAGAWTGLIAGATLAAIGFLLTQFWAAPLYPYLIEHWPALLGGCARVLESIGGALPFVYWEMTADKFPISGQEIYFLTMIVSALGYVTVSLLTCREPYNLDRMLHRGQYRRQNDRDAPPPALAEPLKNWKRVLLGFDEQFTRGDKIMSSSVFIYSMALFAVFLGVIAYDRLIAPIGDNGWATYFWVMNVALALVVGVATSVWFTIGAIRDLRRMFTRLATMDRNVFDDGRVAGHTNVEDLAFVPEVSDNQQPPELEKRGK